MSEGATIKIDGDASGFIAATEESRKAASGMSEALQGAVGGSTGEAVKGLKGMDQEGRKACKRLNAGLINMSATITGVGAAINGLRAGWGKFSAMLAGGDDLERVTRRMEAFTGGASSAAEAARDVVDFADTPPFGLAETQRAVASWVRRQGERVKKYIGGSWECGGWWWCQSGNSSGAAFQGFSNGEGGCGNIRTIYVKRY